MWFTLYVSIKLTSSALVQCFPWFASLLVVVTSGWSGLVSLGMRFLCRDRVVILSCLVKFASTSFYLHCMMICDHSLSWIFRADILENDYPRTVISLGFANKSFQFLLTATALTLMRFLRLMKTWRWLGRETLFRRACFTSERTSSKVGLKNTALATFAHLLVPVLTASARSS